MDIIRFSKSLDRDVHTCPVYADLIHNHGNRPEAGERAIIGLESELLTTKAIHDQITFEQIAELATCEEVIQNVHALIAHFPYWENRHLFHSQIKVGISITGEAIPFDGAPIVSILDLIGVVDGVAIVIDIKTGKIQDYPMERHLYILAARALFPEITEFKFIYLYPVGCFMWMYKYTTPRKVEVTVGT